MAFRSTINIISINFQSAGFVVKFGETKTTPYTFLDHYCFDINRLQQIFLF